ncbi:MAG: 5-formyltetrahydrofolate cyclo-ligase [Eubacteriales bacterium]
MPVNNNDIRIQKTLLRKESKAFRANLSDDEKQRLDRKIANRFLNLWYFRENELLLTFVSNSIEVDTKFIIQQALEQGKRVAVPRCIDGTRNMVFYLINSFDDLSPRSFDILEPSEEKCEQLTDYSGGLCIVPALVFDTNGFRLGFGKGYYDRFLSNSNVKTVGICYDGCISNELPHGKYDKKVSMIVTESRIIDF